MKKKRKKERNEAQAKLEERAGVADKYFTSVYFYGCQCIEVVQQTSVCTVVSVVLLEHR